MRAWLSPREFTTLVNWCETPDGKHRNGGMQNARRKWSAQLRDRGILGTQVRAAPVSAGERYLDLDDADIAMIRAMRAHPNKGGWQRDMRAIFGGTTL
jgi:hypothetical protein